jgi:predicted dehydrogenase
MTDVDLKLDYKPQIDDDLSRFGIGVVGAGFIVRDCHLAAYRDAGFRVVAIASRTAARAEEVAQHHGVARAYQTYGELLEDRDVQVVDIAVPPDRQLGIIRDVVRHNDHVRAVLAQKPLAMSYGDAAEIVRLCEEAGIVLAVNQNMRYDQSVRALKCLLDRGDLGTPVLGTIEMRAIPHWMPWAEQLHSLSTFVMSIHHLDTFRYWFGDPVRVLASTRPDPRTKFRHADGINLYILEFDNGCRASAWDDVWSGPVREGAEGDIYIRWRVEGTEGLARGTIGWPAYPARQPSTLDFSTSRRRGYWFQPRWPEVWFPDAFAGTMGELLMALKHGREPAIGGRDNLKTIALCEAVFQSATEHRVISV